MKKRCESVYRLLENRGKMDGKWMEIIRTREQRFLEKSEWKFLGTVIYQQLSINHKEKSVLSIRKVFFNNGENTQKFKYIIVNNTSLKYT